MQKEPAYAKPGETVDLKLLYWDGKSTESSPRNIEFNFFSCTNPPGDLYYACLDFSRIRPLATITRTGNGAPMGGLGDTDAALTADAAISLDAATPGDAEADATSDDAEADAMSPPEGGTPLFNGDPLVTARVTIDSNVVHPKAQGVAPYGLVYVLFTACAGHFTPVAPSGPNAPPFECRDDDGKALGPDDFVPGYASIYVYDDLRNANPVVNDFSFRTASFKNSPTAPDSDVPHIARCTESDRSKCPSFDIKVAVDRSSAETDPLAKDADGNPLTEQLWVAYHSTAGDFTASLRLVNDASRGWNEDNATKFRAPITPGPVRIFAVVHDNRGGVAWAQGKVIID
jgi:hypothetical protein